MSRPDPRFFVTSEPLTLPDACDAAGASLVQEGGGSEVTHASSVQSAELGAVVFVEGPAALGESSPVPSLALTTEAMAEAVAEAFPEAAIAVAPRPKAAFARLAGRLHRSIAEAGDPPAGIDPAARIAATASVAPSAVVGPGALVHDDAVIEPFAYVAAGVVIGEGARIGAHATVSHAVIGAGCVLSPGARIGSAGFGYAAGEAGMVPVPQLGRVLIGDDVDVGANSCVDRGTLGDTIIGEGTKIDNLCQVAHNCRVGRNVLIASQTGISGSCVIGDGVMIGGQVGMADHLTIGEGAILAAGSGHMKDVPAGERWGGTPAKPARQWMKEVAALSRLAKGTKGEGGRR